MQRIRFADPPPAAGDYSAKCYKFTACSAVVAVSGFLSHGLSGMSSENSHASGGGAPHAAAYIRGGDNFSWEVGQNHQNAEDYLLHGEQKYE